jgi:Tubulin-tyrosine ligase family
VLVSHTNDIYFFKEGYLRTSCIKYDIKDVTNIFMHLTNNAVQKHSKNYGEFEDGNQLSFEDFNKYLQQINSGVDFFTVILPQIKFLSKKALFSVI